MITYMNKQYKLVQFPLYVVLFALFFSCGENDADFTFSDSLKNKYSDAVLGEYETKDTVIAMCLNTGKVFSESFDAKLGITNDGERRLTFYDVPLSSLCNVVSGNQELHDLFKELGSCDISFDYDFVQGNDDESVYLILYGSTYHFVLGKHRIEIRMDSNMKYIFPITNDMDTIRRTFRNVRFRFDVSRIAVDNKEEKDYHLIMFADIK